MDDANKLVWIPFVSFLGSIPDDGGHPLFEVVGNVSFDTLELAQGSIPKSYCASVLFVEFFFVASVLPKMSEK